MFCKNCGKEMKSNATFCHECGANQIGGGEKLPEGILRLKRKRSLADMAVGYKIIIDGKETAEIKQGKQFDCGLPYGKHSIQLKLQWCTSKPIDFIIEDSNKTVQFECHTIFKGLFAVLTGFLVKNNYITLKRI